MHSKKYGKLPPAQDDILAYKEKRRALYLEGLNYIYGLNGKAIDFEVAYPLIKQSADMNEPYAITSIGSFYSSGKIVDQDDSKALKIFTKMCERLNPKAAYNLGIMHKNGRETKENPDLAKKYFDMSIVYAVREAYRGDKLGYSFLKEDLHLSAQQIEKLLAEYIKQPICELCHSFVPAENFKLLLENDVTLLPKRQDLLEVIVNEDYKRGEPVINAGFCCFRCEHHYVKPIREAIENGSVSKKEVAVLEHRDDLIDALNTFLRMD